ncbi:ATP-binding protein [Marinifilum fragile]|uniref:ATP-binding protein n=1 Tax=Marinifilum fragile TaxID=570161 RepID=UPI0009F9FA0E
MTHKGLVLLSVKCLEKTNQYVSLFFTIKDNGIGISKDARKKLFKEFTQSDSSTNRIYGDSGLGLAISKNLTNSLEGKINLKKRTRC